jgi:MFS transporter, DHA3 family, macrolide efflux protein
MHKSESHGFSVFVLIWLGQLVSQLGSALTTFSLGVWIYLQTGSVSQFAIVFLAGTLPATVLSPLAGAIVDRWNRRTVMLACESALALNALVLTWLLSTNRLEFWHAYAAVALASIANAFHWPAYSTLIPVLVPKRSFGRANGMIQAAEAVAQLAAPLIGGILMTTIQLRGILLIDTASFIFALLTLGLVRVRATHRHAEAEKPTSTLFQEAVYGWRYIATRHGLLALMVFFAFSNFLAGVVEVLAQPLILSFASPVELGRALSIGGSGMLIGSVVISVWGGPKRRVRGILVFHLLASLAFISMGWRASLVLATVSAFAVFFCMPIINGCNRALMNVKVEPGVQGRVFATSRMITSLTQPLGYILAGPLADKVFGPLLMTDGPLAGSVGQILGTGPGRGVGLLFVVAGVLGVAVTAAGYLYGPFRRLDSDLPDIAEESVGAAYEEQSSTTAVLLGAAETKLSK